MTLPDQDWGDPALNQEKKGNPLANADNGSSGTSLNMATTNCFLGTGVQNVMPTKRAQQFFYKNFEQSTFYPRIRMIRFRIIVAGKIGK